MNDFFKINHRLFVHSNNELLLERSSHQFERYLDRSDDQTTFEDEWRMRRFPRAEEEDQFSPPGSINGEGDSITVR